MRVILGEGRRGPVAAIAFVVGALALLAGTIVTNAPVQKVLPLIALSIALVAFSRVLANWTNVLIGLGIVILFIPIKRYALPAALPFSLEPYRLVVAAIVLGWLGSLLVDQRVRVRTSGLELPLALVVGATFASDAVNPSRVDPLSADVVKALTFFISFFLVLSVVVSVVKSRGSIESLVKLFVGGGALIAIAAMIERRWDYNVFNHLNSVFPFLNYSNDASTLTRGGRLRVYGPAQHPIALSVLFVVLLPLAIYLAHRYRQKRWLAAAGLLVLGTLATASRTGIVGLVVVGLVFLWLQPRTVRRAWPALVPALIVIHLALPGALGTVRASFFPQGGLVKEQSDIVAGNAAQESGRLTDIGPSLGEWSNKPLFGQGFATRVTVGPNANARLLDDQWLGTLLETGLLGFLGWLWLMTRSVRMAAREARRASGDDDEWLLTGFAAAFAAFGATMVTYDAFSFIQTQLVFFIELGLAAALLNVRGRAEARASAVRAAVPARAS